MGIEEVLNTRPIRAGFKCSKPECGLELSVGDVVVSQFTGLHQISIHTDTKKVACWPETAHWHSACDGNRLPLEMAEPMRQIR